MVMKRVQLTLDEELVDVVDRLAEELGENRSAFTRKALRKEVERIQKQDELVESYVQGYEQQPDDDLDEFVEAQSWPDS
ncbi:MAG: ribbon-helix-helix domain-containing protein [bacterium]